MGKYKQIHNGKGSLKWIQTLVNNYPEFLNEKIYQSLGCSDHTSITWLSPLKEDEYSEYSDEDFLRLLELTKLEVPLSEFWPKQGPQWDALGKNDSGEVFLVEAKAHLSELISSPTRAKDESSLALIGQSLNETKDFLQISSDKDWTSKYYQFTNRLAHLYYLRVKNGIPAYLVFVYFIGDEEVNGPRTQEEWLSSIREMKQFFGIKQDHKLAKFILEIFIDVNELAKLK